MSNGVFLDSSIFYDNKQVELDKYLLKESFISFEFPDGFAELPLIEECRALNCMDFSDMDNFDFMFDITMQMLVGKGVVIWFDDGFEKKELTKFLVTNRYMNLRGVDFINKNPVVVNWLVDMIKAYLSKKYPRSLLSSMEERGNEERMKKKSHKNRNKKTNMDSEK